MDMQQLLAAAQQMQQQLLNAQQELAETEVVGSAGGGLVTATVNGQGELVDLKIGAATIDQGDPAETAETVAELVLAAVRDAYRAVSELQQEKMGPFAEGLGGAGGGMPDLGGAMPDLGAVFGGELGSGFGGEPDYPDDPDGPGHPGAAGQG